MKNIAIVNPPYPDKGHHYVLGIGYISAALRKLGYNPILIDEPCFYYEEGLQAAISALETFKPDAIGIAIPTSLNLHYTYDFVKHLKKNFPAIPLISGGLHSTLMPVEILDSGVDFAIMGDGEETLPNLLKAIFAGDSTEIEGVVFRRDDRSVFEGGPSFVKDINTLPFPENRIIPVILGDNTTEKQLLIITSRGCFRKCGFCVERYLNRGRRTRSVQNVIAEISDAYHNHGVRKLQFLDSSFLESKKFVLELCEEMIKIGPMTWKCMVRADHLDTKILKVMKAAGCNNICVGMESVNDDTLKILHKGINSRLIDQTVDLAERVGIELTGYFIAGLPWESRKELQNTQEFYLKNKDRMSFLFLTALPFPATSLYIEYHEKHGFTNWWTKDNLQPLEKAGQPVFQWVKCRDEVLCRNFYQYNSGLWNLIAWFAQQNSPGKIHSFRSFMRVMGRNSVSLLSRVLFAVSPAMEHRIAAPIYLFFHGKLEKKHHINIQNTLAHQPQHEEVLQEA